MRLGRRFVHELSDTIDFYAGYNAFLADEGSGIYTVANAAV
jgi:hypothetical protein